MNLILTVFITICTVVSALFFLYYIITCFAGLFIKKPASANKEKGTEISINRIAAVIPARNEESVIADIIQSLKEQNYPQDMFDIFVAANNCTDSTVEIARGCGAQIIEPSAPVRNKGNALKQAFEVLSSEERYGHYSFYCIFDADNIVHPDFLKEANRTYCAGNQVAQGFRDIKNPFENWVSGSMAVFYWFMSGCFNQSRSNLGMSCHLNGTGFMISNEVIRETGWNTVSMTEDLEFTALCALHGYKIAWMPEARIFDEQTTGFRTSCRQRHRWTSGSLQCLSKYLTALLRRKNAQCLDVAMLFLGNILCLVGLIPGIGTAIGLLPFFLSKPRRLLILFLLLGFYYLSCCIAAVLICKSRNRLSSKIRSGILGFPFFILSWLPVNLFALFAPAKRWSAVKHSGTNSPQAPR